jgi:two-component system chemotaxis response regulator CheV
MAGVLDGVDRRTQLVGENRLELLLFRLNGPQTYGINVFKVQEVIRCPELTAVPNAHRAVVGIANMRGKTIPVIDLSDALGGPPMQPSERADSFIVIADYNRSIQGFLVASVDRIINMNWESILAPPKGSGNRTYLTAVTRLDDKLIEIIDVEKVLAEIVGVEDEVSEKVVESNPAPSIENIHILVADDSAVARKQIKRTLDQIGMNCTLVKDGKEALDFLHDVAEKEDDVYEHVSLLISDIEMPNMDGYTLTTEIRKHPKLKNMFVILHTSLSGVFNEAMVQKVGANRFIPKFNPDDLAAAVMNGIEARLAAHAAA